jgi:radical SAM protein with 4Fe4S-binding SPASM domain
VVAPPVFDRVRRRLAVVSRLAETWVRRPATPNRVVFDLTRRCNLRCSMCHTWKHTGTGALSAEEIGAVLARLHRLTWLDLTGGEPFVRPDIDAVLSAAVDRTPALRVLHFQTNGWATARIVASTRALRRRRRDMDLIVTVSIDGPEPIHDRVRGRTGSFRRAVATADALMGIADVDVHIGTTITAQTDEHVDALGQALRAALPGFSARRWHLNWAHVSDHFFGNTHVGRWTSPPAGARIRRHLKRRGLPRSMVEAMEAAYLVNFAAVHAGEPSGVPCQALRSTVFISPEGDVYPCHLYDRPLGNVRRRDILDIWASAEVAEARGDIERLACGGCFSACEAYPALAGAPWAALRQTTRRALRLWQEARSDDA